MLEGMSAPSSILLLHGLRGSGQGSVALLEAKLRERGWDAATYLRPTLPTVNHPPEDIDLDAVFDPLFAQAWRELNELLDGRVPHLTVGLSMGGALAAFAPSAARFSVCSPWARFSPEILAKAATRPGWCVLQGAQDTLVPCEPNLAVLPEGTSVTLDPEGDHGFDGWMDRIADWVVRRWEARELL